VKILQTFEFFSIDLFLMIQLVLQKPFTLHLLFKLLKFLLSLF
jgi:hypothetical protein